MLCENEQGDQHFLLHFSYVPNINTSVTKFQKILKIPLFRWNHLKAFVDSICRVFELSLEPSVKRVTEPHANLRVPARVFDLESGAIFAKNSTFVFFDGFAWTPRLRSPSPIMAPGITGISYS